MTVDFQLDGQDFIALNGGNYFTFSPAISFFVNCDTQEEVDGFWGKLSEGGRIIECGWLTDKYGVTWQIVLSILGNMLRDEDAVKSQRVMTALRQMKKLDIKALQQAYDGQ